MSRRETKGSHVRTYETGSLPLFAAALQRQRSHAHEPTDTHTSRARLSTGLRSVDRAMHGGLPIGALTLVAGRPRAGATSFALGCALTALKHGQPVAIFSERLTVEQVRGRLVVLESRVNGYRFSAGVVSDEDRAALDEARGRIAWSSLSVVARPRIGLRTIAEHLFTYRPMLAVVDVVPRADDGLSQSPFDSMMRGMTELATMASEHDVALLVRHALPKRHHPPTLEELPGLGAIASASDSVLLVHREEITNPDHVAEEAVGRAELHLVRSARRQMAARIVPLLFDQRFAGLLDLP